MKNKEFDNLKKSTVRKRALYFSPWSDAPFYLCYLAAPLLLFSVYHFLKGDFSPFIITTMIITAIPVWLAYEVCRGRKEIVWMENYIIKEMRRKQ